MWKRTERCVSRHATYYTLCQNTLWLNFIEQNVSQCSSRCKCAGKIKPSRYAPPLRALCFFYDFIPQLSRVVVGEASKVCSHTVQQQFPMHIALATSRFPPWYVDDTRNLPSPRCIGLDLQYLMCSCYMTHLPHNPSLNTWQDSSPVLCPIPTPPQRALYRRLSSSRMCFFPPHTSQHLFYTQVCQANIL